MRRRDGLAAALAECAGELGVGDEAIDAFAESGGLRHGHHAGGGLLRGCEAEKQLRVAEAVAAGGDGGAVADGLAQAGELRAEPPGVRADPEEAVMQGGGELQVEVAFADVLGLVCERGA